MNRNIHKTTGTPEARGTPDSRNPARTLNPRDAKPTEFAKLAKPVQRKPRESRETRNLRICETARLRSAVLLVIGVPAEHRIEKSMSGMRNRSLDGEKRLRLHKVDPSKGMQFLGSVSAAVPGYHFSNELRTLWEPRYYVNAPNPGITESRESPESGNYPNQ